MENNYRQNAGEIWRSLINIKVLIFKCTRAPVTFKQLQKKTTNPQVLLVELFPSTITAHMRIMWRHMKHQKTEINTVVLLCVVVVSEVLFSSFFLKKDNVSTSYRTELDRKERRQQIFFFKKKKTSRTLTFAMICGPFKCIDYSQLN